ncbi:hypothetical protein GCM10010124_19520 [Pilimelia terevasa]|uniref:Ricin B lectin domain-containing protein n=2 Tax=Pilimelia terevasa TaxID=53372 RepID=A0A8J3BJL3_9ACTN|nr:hypothetical protein GCM10010124_19520 [Pilimelia terevasa]
MLSRAACLAAAGITALAFFPGAAQARPFEERPQTAVNETFVGEGFGKLAEAEEEAENSAYRQARRAGYDNDDCKDERVQKDPQGSNWKVRHTIRCWESDDDDDDNGGGGNGGSLVNADSELCFDASNNRPRIEECDGSREQEVDYTGKELQVLNRCLGVSGNRVTVSRCDDGNDQRWNKLNSNNRTVLLENRQSGTCLAVLDADLDEGSAVGTRSCDNAPTQEWKIRG